jgi:hypothetical protein
LPERVRAFVRGCRVPAHKFGHAPRDWVFTAATIERAYVAALATGRRRIRIKEIGHIVGTKSAKIAPHSL